MSETNVQETLQGVASVVHKTRSALRRRARLDASACAFLWGSVVAAIALVVARLAGVSTVQAWWLLLIVPLGAVAGACFGTTTVGDAYRVAKQLDAQLGLKDHLAGGYDLLRRTRAGEAPPPTAFTALVIADAAAAADEARRRLRVPMRLPAGFIHGAVCLALAAVLSLFVLPRGPEAPAPREVPAEQRAQAQALNELADTIEAMEGLDEEQKEALVEALREIRIDRDELQKMSRADIIRRLKEAGAKIKVPEGVGAEAVRRAIEDKMRAIAEMDQIKRQLAEIAAINQSEAVIDLGDGRTTLAGRIKLEDSDMRIDQAIAAALARPGEAERDVQDRIAAAETRARRERERIRKFLAKTVGKDLPAADVQKLTALLASDAEFQGKVLEAIRDGSGEKFDAMREIYRRQLEREFERENIPRGLRNQLSTYLGR